MRTSSAASRGSKNTPLSTHATALLPTRRMRASSPSPPSRHPPSTCSSTSTSRTIWTSFTIPPHRRPSSPFRAAASSAATTPSRRSRSLCATGSAPTAAPTRFQTHRGTSATSFSHRGILIDTARHFFPTTFLKKQVLDAMAFAKMNVFHWHLSDAQSFPVVLDAYPELARKGAFSPGERYAPSEVSDIVRHAFDRGIRVVFEFDTPAHSGALCKSHPEVCPTPLCSQTEPSWSANSWTLDFTRNETYSLVNGVLSELVKTFSDEFVHLGGDEVDYACWLARPYIVQWLKERNLTIHQAFGQYVDRVQGMARSLHNKTPIQWQEIFQHFGTALSKDVVIQLWLPNSNTLIKNVTSNKYRVIYSDSSRWYLDQPWSTWQHMYEAEPCDGLTAEECQLVLGGESCLWSEFADVSNLGLKLWPRSAAVAERLWSASAAAPKNYNNNNNNQDKREKKKTVVNMQRVGERLKRFRCVIDSRGVSSEATSEFFTGIGPVWPGGCDQ